MSMESGSATSPSDLLDKLRVFAESNGWTINRHSNDGLGRQLSMNKAGGFFHFRSLINESCPQNNYSPTAPNYVLVNGANPGSPTFNPRSSLLFVGSNSYDSSKVWWQQPGAYNHLENSGGYLYYDVSQILTSGAIPGYTFASHGNCIYIVIERAAGYFEWGMFGTMEKIGTWTGGQFYSSSGHSVFNYYPYNNYGFFGSRGFGFYNSQAWGMVYVGDTVDNVAPGWRTHLGNAHANGSGRVFDSIGLYKSISDLSPNTMNSLVTIYPITLYLMRNGSNDQNTPFSPIGTLPNIYMMNLRSLVPATDYSIGIESFRVFPFQHKDGYRINEYTGSYTSQGALGFGIKSN